MRDKDLAHIEEHMKAYASKGGDVSWQIHDDRSLLALQGPVAATVLQHLTKGEDLSKMYCGNFKVLDINGGSHASSQEPGTRGKTGLKFPYLRNMQSTLRKPF
ncbi:unnamed protein product [Cuscuta campestris]|uniref:Uncharacterized protein n=1 Tax=Cuscuta campestris TaxID=132261 RepID=A0A484K6X5_9ASTE|nr:unnamed protein product [Cuscuta campestris]